MAIKAGDTSSEGVVAQNEVAKTDKNEEALKERPSKKNRKKEKEHVEKPSVKAQIKKRLLVLPFEASILAILLLILLGAFYVVMELSSFSIYKKFSVKNLYYFSPNFNSINIYLIENCLITVNLTFNMTTHLHIIILKSSSC